MSEERNPDELDIRYVTTSAELVGDERYQVYMIIDMNNAPKWFIDGVHEGVISMIDGIHEKYKTIKNQSNKEKE